MTSHQSGQPGALGSFTYFTSEQPTAQASNNFVHIPKHVRNTAHEDWLKDQARIKAGITYPLHYNAKKYPEDLAYYRTIESDRSPGFHKRADEFHTRQQIGRAMQAEFDKNLPKEAPFPMTNEELAAAQQAAVYQMFPHLRPAPARTVEQMERIDLPVIPIDPIRTAVDIGMSVNPVQTAGEALRSTVLEGARDEVRDLYNRAYAVGKAKDRVLDSVVFPK